jgi:hypothetical protein
MALAMTELVQEIRQERHKKEGARGLSDFQKNNPPTFKGGYNPDGAELWIQKLEKIFFAMNCTDEQKVTYAVYTLEGDAEQWWRATRQLIPVGEPITWAFFLEKFFGKYFPNTVRRAKESEFLYLR